MCGMTAHLQRKTTASMRHRCQQNPGPVNPGANHPATPDQPSGVLPPANARLCRATVSPRDDAWLSDTRSSYDTDACGYAEKVRGLLGDRPYLRASLALFAELVHR